jgi:hypothetical protein
MITTAPNKKICQNDVVHAEKIADEELLDLLINAKEIIRKGWCQGSFHNPGWIFNDKFCVIGALREADGLNNDFINKYSSKNAKLQNLFCITNEIPIGGIINWNDSEKRTKKDVLNAFDKTIEFCKKGT